MAPNYLYNAVSKDGEEKKGTLGAENKSNLAGLLREQGLMLVSAQKVEEKKKGFPFSISSLKKVSLQEKLMLTRNLRVMIVAGLALPRALEVLIAQTENKKLAGILTEVRQALMGGESFSGALTEHPDVFSELFLSMIKVGETSGQLGEVLQVLARQMERRHKLKSEITGALVYPAVIILAMLGIGAGMLVFVVPKIAETFEELETELPIMTKFVISLGTNIAEYWHILILAFSILVFGLSRFLKTSSGKRIVSILSLKIPIFSSLIKQINTAYVLRSLSSLISAGVGLPKSLTVVAGTSSNIFYKESMEDASEKVKKGEKLSIILGRYEALYPVLVVQMTCVGEETGETSGIMEQLADFYEAEVTNVTKNLASIIEPIVMLVIGGAIGFFAVSMIQPMYSILGSVQ